MPGASGPFDLQGKLRIDLSQVEQLPVEVQAALAKMGTKPTNVQVNVLDAQAKASIATTKKDLTALGATTFKPKVQLETAQATKGSADLRAAFARDMAAIDQTVAKTQAGIDKLKGTGGGGTGAGTTTAAAPLSGGVNLGTTMMAGSMVVAGLGGAALILKSTTDVAAGAVRQTESVNRAFKASGEVMNKYAQDLSTATGYQAMLLKESQVAFKTISDTVPMTNERLNELVGLATDLAQTSPIAQYRDNIEGVTKAMMLGLQGGGSSSTTLKALGITLDDVYMKSEYLNGALKDVWATMSPAQKATERLNALFLQTADIQGIAGRSTSDATKQLKAENAMLEARIALGNAMLPILQTVNTIIARTPKLLLEAAIILGAIAAVAVPAAMAVSMMGGRGLIGGLGRGGARGLAAAGAAEAETAVAGQVVGRGLIASITRALKTEVTTANFKGVFTSIGAAGKAVAAEGGLAKLGGQITALGKASVGTLGPLALIAVAVGALGMYLKHIAGGTEEALNQQETLTKQGIEAEQALTAKKIAAETGQTVAGLRPEDAARYAAAGYTHYGLAFNARGQALVEPNRGKFDAGGYPVRSRVDVNINVQTPPGTQLDANSNSPGPY